MKLSATFLHSKVARRVFTLFVIAALIPTLALAFISFRQVNTQLNEQIAHQTHTESKLLGMAILERLASIDHVLRSIATELGHDLASGEEIDLTRYLEDAGATFRELRFAATPAEHPLLASDNNEFAAPRAGELEHLQRGRALLRTVANGNDAPRILLIRLVHPGVPSKGLIIGEIDQAYLFDFSGVGDHLICILDAAGHLLACPDEASAALAQYAPQVQAGPNSGSFDWQGRYETYRAGYWKAFLKPNYYSPPWTAILSKPRSDLVAQVDEFKALFPPIIGLSLLIVSWLSLTQIRRYLVPLGKLRAAADKVANKDFAGSVVTVDSGDEFEELAQAFNTMAASLQKQFSTLSAMAEIDRSILSTLEADYVIETLLLRIQDVVTCDAACIVVLEPQTLDETRVYLHWRDGESLTETVTITDREMDALDQATGIVVPDLEASTPSYLASLRAAGLTNFQVLPIRVQERLAALIALAYRADLPLEQEDLVRARELADRAAVALSNAAWQEKLYHQAHYDALTDLPNRILLRDRLLQALARAERQGTQVGVLFIDLDRFKNVNDSLGHSVGDELLVHVAQALGACVRASDTVVRLGGDEFMVILPDIDEPVPPVTTRYTAKILDALSAPFTIAEREVTVTASIGIALFPRDGRTVDDLMRNADSAMYHAKEQGRNNYQFYSEHLNAKALQRLTLETKLRRALECEQFELFYQPQVSTYTGALVGAEALLRWRDPEAGLVSPAEFIPLAEETGLIVPIGEWVIESACAQSSRWNADARSPLRVAVNMSARQFRDTGLVPIVAQALATYKLDPKLLELELTESVAMNDISAAIATLRSLEALGVHLSLDDFGTGYSSLSCLHQLPLHALKIDQSFVRRLPSGPGSIATVKAIITLAHGLDLSLIAEGVETIAQLDFLKLHECEKAQGYLISKPLPAKEFAEKFLSQGTVAGHRAMGAGA